MAKVNYIIFHPDQYRQKVEVNATAVCRETVVNDWKGNIYVDSIGKGNEDPFVFDNPWLYSYCHASQLRRKPRGDNEFLQQGSVLIFVSGESANRQTLCVDTVFVIGKVQKWSHNPLRLPSKYQTHFESIRSKLWLRHFRYPFMGEHDSVTHSYESQQYRKKRERYSFLPYDQSGERVEIPFGDLSSKLSSHVEEQVKGKYPVLIDEKAMEEILHKIESEAVTKVVGNISSDIEIEYNKGHC